MIETEILKLKDPNVKETDNWPTYVLKDVIVEDANNGQLCSLLRAEPQVPLNVTGILSEVEEKLKNNCKCLDVPRLLNKTELT